METAKVDIRKLQALNDRINQCIDALNQVRLSVHGLAHTTPAGPFIPAGVGQLAPTPFGVGYPGLGSIPLGSPYAQPLGSPYAQGFSHTTPMVGGPGTFAPGFGPALNPFAGLSHSSPEESRPGWPDPFLAARIAQTFPYAQYPFPAVVTIF
jgi:hypothetical protein